MAWRNEADLRSQVYYSMRVWHVDLQDDKRNVRAGGGVGMQNDRQSTSAGELARVGGQDDLQGLECGTLDGVGSSIVGVWVRRCF